MDSYAKLANHLMSAAGLFRRGLPLSAYYQVLLAISELPEPPENSDTLQRDLKNAVYMESLKPTEIHDRDWYDTELWKPYRREYDLLPEYYTLLFNAATNAQLDMQRRDYGIASERLWFAQALAKTYAAGDLASRQLKAGK